MPCRNHAHIDEGLEHCEICTETYCADCLVDFRESRTCGECKAQIVADLEGGLGVGGDGEMPPWERRDELGLFGAFWETTKRATLTPTAFFAGVDKRAERWDCLVYAMIVQTAGAIVLWGMIAAFLMIVAGTQADSADIRQALAPFGVLPMLAMQVIFAPVGAVVGALLYASLVHLFLIVTKTNSRPWHQTLRHYCYARAPLMIMALPLPPLTWGVASIWSLVSTVIMVKRVHGTTTGTAAAAVFWIFVLLCCCFAGGFGLIGAIAATASSGG